MKPVRFAIASRAFAVSGAVVFLAALMGCAASTRTLVPGPAAAETALAKIVVTRPSFAIGGMLDMVVLDTGDVVGVNGVVTKSALWCDWAATARPIPESTPLAAVVREYRTCRVQIIATTGADGLTSGSSLIRPKQFRRLQGARADLKDQDPTDSICLQSPEPECQHGVEVGQVGPGGQLVWYRRPGPMTIRILSPNAQPPYNFSSEAIAVEAGKTYTFEARHGVVRPVAP